ncbi:MAG: cupin domain-containing protein [Dehalococcoidia bacterium]|nr:cupin domain-containing protein [Dehalococcoidia bacterium]
MAGLIVFEGGQGTRYEARGSEMFFKATGASTGGRLSLMERTLPPGGRMPPAHVHEGNDEAYFILDGRVTFLADGEELVLGRDGFVLIPGGISHTFGNRGDAPARLLVLHVPALDGYFAELEQLWQGRVPSPEEERALMARHGMRT